MADWQLPDVLSILRDTANGVVDWRTLNAEIAALDLGYAGHRSSGDELKLYFEAARTTAEQTTIKAVVTAHIGVEVRAGTRVRCADGKMVEATSFAAGSVTWTEIT